MEPRYRALTFLTWAVDGDELLSSCPGRFTPDTYWIGGWVSSRVEEDVVEKRKPFTLPRFGTRPNNPYPVTTRTMLSWLLNIEMVLSNTGYPYWLVSLAFLFWPINESLWAQGRIWRLKEKRSACRVTTATTRLSLIRSDIREKSFFANTRNCYDSWEGYDLSRVARRS
jgi:hypothetical protein